MSKRLVNTIAALVVSLALMTGIGTAFSGGTVYAASAFTDLPNNYWAESEITFAASKGIVNGYEAGNGTYIFQPENPVSYEEAATMLYRSLDAAGQLKKSEEAINELDRTEAPEIKYAEVLDAAHIASWAREYVAYCLENDIINESELGLFVNTETNLGNSAPRLTVAIWTAKALDKDLAGVVNLPFIDASQIDDTSAVYVDMLYRHGIMQGSLQTDGSIAFQPASGVKRSEFAAIANRVFNNAGEGYDINKETFNYITDEKTSFYDGAQIRIIGSLGTEMIGKYKAGVVVSGMTFHKGETPQAHYVGAPTEQKGTVVSSEKLTDDTARVVITTSGKDIAYLLDAKTVNTAKIKQGTSVRFIADGINLIEVK